MPRFCFLVLVTLLNLLVLKLPAAALPSQATPVSSDALCQPRQPLQDWAQLAVYRQATLNYPPPATGEPRVVFFGDSITSFWNLSTFFPGQPYINRGIPGQTTPQMLIRFRPEVIALKPRVVVILAGTNDLAGNTGFMTLDQIENNYASLTELATAHQIRVVFASVLPVYDYRTSRIVEGRQSIKIESLNQWLKGYCTTNHCLYLDYYSYMVNHQGKLRVELSDDGLHPNAKGYNVMAPLAARAIQQALSLPAFSSGSLIGKD